VRTSAPRFRSAAGRCSADATVLDYSGHAGDPGAGDDASTGMQVAGVVPIAVGACLASFVVIYSDVALRQLVQEIAVEVADEPQRGRRRGVAQIG
jgi:hypothetical protein